jgi:hypothetical protein
MRKRALVRELEEWVRRCVGQNTVLAAKIIDEFLE